MYAEGIIFKYLLIRLTVPFWEDNSHTKKHTVLFNFQF